MYTSAAQYNEPPRYPVTVICGGIDGASFGSDILSKIYAGLVAYKGNTKCKVNGHPIVSETTVGWKWQTCSEMVIPFGIGNKNNTMFQPEPFSLKSFAKECKKHFGVSPRPHWITTYYGGHNIKLVLQKFGSNIIFSNGLRDPYSSGGVLKNISDSLVAIHTVNGSHCLDIQGASKSDPEWLVEQRRKRSRL
ncbi:Lysosomal Pro-X carboxypeptidase [Spatholobus suberectus]|nr:Lysosomal Pro-X carboxypeptidase [Spatholobus suberectus]